MYTFFVKLYYFLMLYDRYLYLIVSKNEINSWEDLIVLKQTTVALWHDLF